MGLTFWIVLSPLIAALLALILPGLNQRLRRLLLILGVVVSLVCTLIVWGRFAFTAGPGLQSIGGVADWFTLPNLSNGDVTVGLTFGVDGLSLPLATMALVVALLALIGKNSCQRVREYYFWFGLAVSGVLGVFLANDLFAFVLSLELTLFATFFLIYLFGKPDLRRKAAFKFLIYRGFASVAILVALIGLAYSVASSTGAAAGNPQHVSFNISALMQTAGSVTHGPGMAWRSGLFLVLLLGVFIEEAFVPLHTWLPEAHEAADTPTNMLLGGVLTKTGAYALLRFGAGMLPDQVHHYGQFVAILGVINILYGAFAAWRAEGWRRLIAFGSISHMGLVLLGIAAMNAAGLQGAMFMMVSSGLLTALLFYLTASIEERVSHSIIGALGGLSKPMPLLSGFLLFAALGSLGLPLTSGFVSEVQAFMGGFGTFPAVAFVGLGGLILSACYLLYAIQKTTFGPLGQEMAATPLYDARWQELIPTVVFTALVILIGVYPHVIGQFFNQSVTTMLGIGG